jgi:hypothetical protein
MVNATEDLVLANTVELVAAAEYSWQLAERNPEFHPLMEQTE